MNVGELRYKDKLRRFAVSSGLICCVGEAVSSVFSAVGFNKEDSAAATAVLLVLIGVILTGVGLYEKIAKYAGAGTLVPITGFANAVASAAIEFKAEGFITGMAAKMFVIAGPVIVYGVSASVIYGIIYWISTL